MVYVYGFLYYGFVAERNLEPHTTLKTNLVNIHTLLLVNIQS